MFVKADSDGTIEMRNAQHVRFTRLTRDFFSSLLILSLLSIWGVGTVYGDDGSATEQYLDLPLQDLLSIEVTSVSKRLQQLKEAAAAIHVITREDIRRSGVTSIPDALRMAPGIQVARLNANKWAISARGFNSQWANKLLVLIDGRSVYVPSFSGVYWEMQDLVLDDIDRIEVIRGPGATLWGANAVNGIINIITRSAGETTGGLVTIGGGSEQQSRVELRYGAALGEAIDGRVYLKYQETDSFTDFATGRDANDDWNSIQAGFRMDGQFSDRDDWTLQGDIFDVDANQFVVLLTQPTPPFNAPQKDPHDADGWNLLGRWNRAWSETSTSTLQVYYDRHERDEIVLTQSFGTFDIDFQHQLLLGERHNLIAGFGYRRIEEEFRNSFTISVRPAEWEQDLYSAFIQDEITLIADRLQMTIGSKFENNDYTGFEVQPSVRLLWTPNAANTFWAAVSRAVRTPSRVESYGRIVTAVVPVAPPPVPPLEISLSGNPRQDSETLIAYEMGYRAQPTDKLSLDIAVFFNDYDELQTFDTPMPPVTLTFANGMEAETYGVEIAADWRPLDWWRLQTSYSYLDISADLKPGARDFLSVALREGSSPNHQISVRSAMDLGADWSLDVWAYYVSSLSDLGTLANQDVNAYTSVNVRLAWQPLPGMELSVVGRDLTEERHLEYVGESYLGAAKVERSVFAQLRWEW